MDAIMDGQTQAVPPPVSERAMQGGETHARWAWVEECVWTERMLTALEQGVKGGVWFSLIDKVYALPNLRASFAKVKSNDGAAGVDHQTIAMFERRLDANLTTLADELRRGTYQPQRIRRVWIPKPGKPNEKRPLGIPTVRDRVVQTALRNVLEPIFERDFAAHSYGFRPGKGCKDALRRVDALLKQGYVHVIDADLKSYFDTIPWQPLLERIRVKVADRRVFTLIDQYLNQKVLDGLKEWTPETGSPQGAVLSPLLSNIYLDPLDQHMAHQGWEMVRYADDFVVLCRTREDAEAAMREIQQWTKGAGLTLHPEKTRIVDASQRGGFDFLGYHFERERKWPSSKSWRKLKDSMRPLTKRTSGHSLDAIIAKVNPILRGWFEYFKHCPPYSLKDFDGWLRGRLRSILRKRKKRKGMSRGRENFEWPNRFFAEAGLFALKEARLQAGQSSRRSTINRRAGCG
jgi:RNA-directed DNA polymerase